MSAQTDELKNIIASLTNVVASLEAEETGTPVAPEVPVATETETPAPEAAPVETETPAEEAAEEAAEAPEAPADGTVAPNTPSAG